MDEPSPTPDVAPAGRSGEPDVIRRLVAKGVAYTFIKMVVINSPLDPLTTLLLHPNGAANPLGGLFRTATYGKILAAVAAEEARVRSLRLVSEAQRRAALRELTHLKFTAYQALLTEPALAKQDRRFVLRLIPTGFDNGAPMSQALLDQLMKNPGKYLGPLPGTPVYINAPSSVQVWTLPKRRLSLGRLLATRTIPSGDGYPEAFCQAVAELLHAHCSAAALMRIRFRATWRTARNPEAWPAVTRYLIPALYDFLKPAYPARRYTHGRLRPGPGAFPAELINDIAEVLRVELPGLAGQLRPSQVRDAIRRYLHTADPQRPLGPAMFKMPTSRL